MHPAKRVVWLGLAAACSRAPVVDAPAPPPTLDDTASIARGRALFLTTCAHCHGEQADGHGIRRSAFSVPPRDFTRPGWDAHLSPRALFAVIRDGKPGTPMPSWRALPDHQLWDLVSYLRSVPAGGE